MEQKQTFFITCFKPEKSLQNQAFQVETSLFNEETRCVISLIAKFLGLDSNRHVTQSLMSVLFKISTSQVDSIERSHSYCLKFHQFLAESIPLNQKD